MYYVVCLQKAMQIPKQRQQEGQQGLALIPVPTHAVTSAILKFDLHIKYRATIYVTMTTVCLAICKD